MLYKETECSQMFGELVVGFGNNEAYYGQYLQRLTKEGGVAHLHCVVCFTVLL